MGATLFRTQSYGDVHDRHSGSVRLCQRQQTLDADVPHRLHRERDFGRLRVQIGSVEDVMKDAPETFVTVAAKLAQEASHSDEASRALQLLYRLVGEVAQ